MNNSKKRNIAVILAAGKGTRMGADCPKQFLPLAGKMVIEHTVAAFESHRLIDEITIVTNEEYIETFKDIVRRNNWKKVINIIQGGKERYHSSLAAIECYKNEPHANILIHDGVRPFVSSAIISSTIEQLTIAKAVNVAVEVTDTIFVVENSLLKEVPRRECLRRAQTPQGFDLSTLRDAYQKGIIDPHFSPTDDCSVVLKYQPDVDICIVAGEEKNIKITYKEDIAIAERLLSREMI